ncbi:MAG: HAD-IC family P-type ATPase [Myxococcales bacterium]|jgi:Ca2+-transporting ATPase
MQAQDVSPKPRVEAFHTSVSGRARIHVPGLYRSHALADRLEQSLQAHPGIRSIRANPRTGNALVLFEPRLGLQEVCQIVDSMLEVTSGDVVALPKRRRNRAPDSRVANTIATALKKARAGLHREERSHPEEGRLIHVAFPQADVRWHLQTKEKIIAMFESSATNGLAEERVQQLLSRYGPNALPRAEARSSLLLFLDQFKTLPVALLGVSAGVSVLTGGILDAAVIGTVVVTNALIGFGTESQIEKSIRSLTEIAPIKARVIRDGHVLDAEAENIVPGDLLVLSRGTRIVADARVLEAERLDVDESALTGESVPVTKQTDALLLDDAPLADRTNMVYSGTVVTGGSGLAMVVATGLRTELGRVHELVSQAKPPETPSQRELRLLGNQLVWAGAAVCGAMFGVGMLRGYGWVQMARSSISLAVAALPEGLPTLAMTVLSLGVRDLKKRDALVRHIDAVETLGAPQIICLDKTGTITANRMSVVSIFADETHRDVSPDPSRADFEGVDVPQSASRRLLEMVALCNEIELEKSDDGWALHGSPTERALMEASLAQGIDVRALRAKHPLLNMQLRADDRNYMVSTHSQASGGTLRAVKGSPQQVLSLCDRIYVHGAIRALDESDMASVEAENGRMAGRALRVLGVAYDEREGDAPQRLIWLGLVGMTDPPRAGMRALIEEFHQAGIDTAMITGDQSATAYAIAKELHLARDGMLEILDSTHMEEVPPEVLSSLAQRVQVFSRVSPAHKLEIVQALQRGGRVVAMTGDGINDGPALRAADVGIAMGATGSEVAREVADVVLERDDLESLVEAIKQGRTIHDNIRKSVHFLLSSNTSEILVMMGGISAGLGEPLTPIQLLWLNLITDIFPGLGLAVEPSEPDVMQRPPRGFDDPLLRRSDFTRIVLEGTLLAGGTLGAYGWALRRYGTGPKPGSVAFMTITIAQLFHALSCRSEYRTIFDRELGPMNFPLKLGVGGSLALQIVAATLPGLRSLLGLGRLGARDWLAIGLGAGVPLLTNEALKKVGFWRREFEPATAGASRSNGPVERSESS